MAQVRYFPRYSQRENFQTNNTLLLLYRLYDYSRFRFEKFLSGLLRHANTEPGSALTLGLQITQQVGTGAGIVDGFLNQESLRIAIEAKRSSEGFYPEQINRFLSGFNPPNGGFLILLSPDHVQIDGPDWSDVAASAKVKNVTLVPVTFENIISAAKECLHPYDEEMHDLVTDYEEFCSDEELLPVDKWTLFAPPCGLSHEINVANQLYFCPASWSRRRARYLGIYYDKAVRHIGTIVKVVECEINKDGGVTSGVLSLTEGERQRIVRASKDAMEQRGWDLTTERQFFLCDKMIDTAFEKSSPGGIMNVRYFDLREYFTAGVPAQLAEIAEGLRNHKWE